MRSFLNLTGVLVAKVAYFFGIRKKVTLDNLNNAYPTNSLNKQKEIAKRSYRNLGIVFAEMLYLRFADKKNIAKHISVSNPKIFHDLIRDIQNGLLPLVNAFD